MTDSTITQTITFSDLITAHQGELDDLRDAYQDVQARASEEFGEDALDRPIPQNISEDAQDELRGLQQEATVYNESAKSIQQRVNALKRLEGEYGDGDFEIRMLSGSELMDIERALRTEPRFRDVPRDAVQGDRKAMVGDVATVEAPEGVPRDDDGSPTPSECPNPLTLSLYEQVELLNNGGGVDFRPPGFDDEPRGVASSSSGVRTPSESE